MRTYRPARGAVLSVVALLGGATVMRADSNDEIRTLREQIQQLDQKLRILERTQELKDEAAAAAAKSAPKLGLTDKGFTLASGDGANSIRLRGLAQLDARFYFGADGATRDSFVLRRARIITEGTFAKNFSFQLVPEFGGSNASILDANLAVALGEGLRLRAGKFKVPVGLELLQSDAWTFFDERALPTNLVPNRDLGVQLEGSLRGGTLTYAAGIFGGVGDGASTTNADFDGAKDFVARVFAQPFKNIGDSPLAGLSVGIAGSLGREQTASALTSGYKTAGQQTFFKFKSGVVNDGDLWRVSPQFDYRAGPFGAIGEYVVSAVNVRPGPTGARAGLRNKAWQLAAGWVLTGEHSSYNGVVPKTNFDPTAGTWGAFEIAVRYENLRIDDAAFPTFADPAANANVVSTFGIGLNWYLSKVVRATFDYYTSSFDTKAAPTAALLQQDERALITRLQVSF
jgi:phosphate-selective porin OprO/OprP